MLRHTLISNFFPFPILFLFFFNDTATTEIYTLSLHDALPISALRDPGPRLPRLRAAPRRSVGRAAGRARHRREDGGHAGAPVWIPRRHPGGGRSRAGGRAPTDRKSTRLNSSH